LMLDAMSAMRTWYGRSAEKVEINDWRGGNGSSWSCGRSAISRVEKKTVFSSVIQRTRYDISVLEGRCSHCTMVE
jgi:hypothetical protein